MLAADHGGRRVVAIVAGAEPPEADDLVDDQPGRNVAARDDQDPRLAIARRTPAPRNDFKSTIVSSCPRKFAIPRNQGWRRYARDVLRDRSTSRTSPRPLTKRSAPSLKPMPTHSSASDGAPSRAAIAARARVPNSCSSSNGRSARALRLEELSRSRPLAAIQKLLRLGDQHGFGQASRGSRPPLAHAQTRSLSLVLVVIITTGIDFVCGSRRQSARRLENR